MQQTTQQIFIKYEEAIRTTTKQIATLKLKIDRFSIIRLSLLLAEIGLFILFVSSSSALLVLVSGFAMILPVLIFVFVVKHQNLLNKQAEYLQRLLWVYQNETDVIGLQHNGYNNGEDFEDENHPYLSDLDIFGKTSLFALINRCTTQNGISLLAKRLSSPNTKEAIDLRQQAVNELKDQVNSTFNFRAILKDTDKNGIEQLEHKLNHQLAGQLFLERKSILSFYIKILPYLMPVLILAAVLFGDSAYGLLMLLLLFNAGLTFFFMKKINLVYNGFGKGAALLQNYAAAIKWTEDIDWKSQYIKSLFASQDKVSDEVRKLAKIIQAFDARLNLLVGSVLNFMLLWDLKCCLKLGKWHQESSSSVASGLSRIGDFEELISIATLSYNQPGWVFPEIVNDFTLQAEAMGHPLIPFAKRINNNFNLLAKPTVDIITGSNMAGKSTFLRTIGINMILGYAGAPVCAESMRMSIFDILTYMRIKDSLNESTSTFKAELNRLKMILTKVQENQNSFVLIDEMLRGTNSKDKFLGSKVFIEKLIKLGAPTLFATHDLQLAELQQIHPQSVRNFHFDIQINHGEMEFDYKIKNGPCDKFNAAILLKEIGLSIEG